jgi:hypothetical protein
MAVAYSMQYFPFVLFEDVLSSDVIPIWSGVRVASLYAAQNLCRINLFLELSS